MSDARRPASASATDEQLEAALRDLAPQLEYPVTPDLAASVSERVRTERPPARRPWAALEWVFRPGVPFRRSVVLAIAALLLAVGAAVAIQLGLRGLPIVFVPSLPPAPPTATTPIGSPGAGLPGSTLLIGEPSTLEAARAAADFPVRLATLPELGAPDAVYIGRTRAGARVELVYRARPGLPDAGASGVGLLITQFKGRTEPELMKKVAGPGTVIEPVRVNGAPGYWITGRPHALIYRVDGEGEEEPYRLVGDVLIWEQDGVIYRIESALGRDATVRIAESMR